MRLFVSGTDTGVGKTHVACALYRTWTRPSVSVGLCKPVATGLVRRGGRIVSDDALRFIKTARLPMSDYPEVNPVLFDPPVSPHLAARLARRPIPLSALRTTLLKQSRRWDVVLIEGIGGVATPLTDRITWADWMASFPAPVTVLVCSPRVGTLNHTVMSLEFLSKRRVTCAGLVICKFNASMIRHRENLRELGRLTRLPVWTCPYRSTRLSGVPDYDRFRSSHRSV